MHILIIGLGLSGRAVEAYCKKRGDRISLFDDKLAPHHIDLETIELVVKSPGIPFNHPLVAAAESKGIPVIGEIDLALSELKGKTLLAITGSNGKTTTTLFTTHLLNLSGKKAIAVGNIGKPLISEIANDADTFVIELSSFQLEGIKQKPLFDGAAFLNLTPNHLDRHQTFEAYKAAKLRLCDCLKPEAPFYISQDVASRFSIRGKIFDIETISSLSYRLYRHDVENFAAAFALSGVSLEILKEGIETFQKPPHRIEFVREYKGVAFINDSKATSVDAVTKAVEAIPTPIVLIAGGVDKGGSFANWLPLFQGKVRMVVALGEAAGRIEKELNPYIAVERVSTLEEGVKVAAAYAQMGETVLLSPGCSSYDQFRSYEHRGDRFKVLVKEIL